MNNRDILNLNGPLLIACNHPDSFLDAIILCTLFKKPIHSLARGDVFKKPLAAWLLRGLHMLPVYRVSEGVENLEENYTTFEACKEVFKQNGIVLIFSEGLCQNEWHLRSLKKGTARLAEGAWEEGIPLSVLPTGLNYDSFTKFPKTLHINFGEVIHGSAGQDDVGSGKKLLHFNEMLNASLKPLVYEIPNRDSPLYAQHFPRKKNNIGNILLTIPAVAANILHGPIIALVQRLARKRALGTGHYDSVIVGLLFFLYPAYIVVLQVALSYFVGIWSFLIWPFSWFIAWCYARWR